METIKYADNSNGKLLCTYFPDVRKPLGEKYTIGNILEIHHESIGFLGYAKVVAVLPFKYKNITDNMAYAVIGHNANYLRKMLNQFYENINQETDLVHVILQFTERHAETLHTLLERHYNKLLSITPRAAQYADGPHLTQ